VQLVWLTVRLIQHKTISSVAISKRHKTDHYLFIFSEIFARMSFHSLVCCYIGQESVVFCIALSFKELVANIQSQPTGRVATVLSTLNSELRTELISTSLTSSTIPAPSIARLLLYYAYSLSDEQNGSSANRPQWKQVAEQLESFVSWSSKKRCRLELFLLYFRFISGSSL